jgi:hypothetical protein
MQANSTIESPDSPVPGAIPDPVPVRRDAESTPTTASHRRNPAGIVLAKLLSAIRGDRYMADAYAADGPGSATHGKER